LSDFGSELAVNVLKPNRNVQVQNFSVKNVKLHSTYIHVSESTIPRYTSEKQGHYTMGKKPL
jgi:hypothetical protein